MTVIDTKIAAIQMVSVANIKENLQQAEDLVRAGAEANILERKMLPAFQVGVGLCQKGGLDHSSASFRSDEPLPALI